MQITPYHFYKVNYESSVSWRLTTDYLRTSPAFHGRPRFDFVMVQAEKPFFGQLLYVFTCSIDTTSYPVALVQPYDVVSRNHRPIQDKELGLLQVRKGKVAEFISLHSVIRGAVLIPAEPDAPEDCLIFDVLDEDMFLRVRDLFPGRTATPSPFN